MFRIALASAAAAAALAAGLAGQEPPVNGSPAQPGPIIGRKSPPQPIQRQALDYFLGTWTFKWTGRESTLSAGPRSGTVTYTRLGDGPFASMAVEGTIEGGGAFRETGTLGWHEAQKVIALHEKVAGVDLLSVGDWTSPISIRFDSAPIEIKGERLTRRRTMSIVSPHSFTIADEVSTNGGPFVRLGGGVFSKPAAKPE